MVIKETRFSVTVVILSLCVTNISLGENLQSAESEKQQYKQDTAHIKDLKKTFTPGPTNDLEAYERFADEIQNKWKQANKEWYGRLMLEICGPLSSGAFEDDQRYEVARKYALSVLAEPNTIPLTLELELTGHVVTLMYTPNAPKGQDFAQRRKKDAEVRLHAWKRLVDAIDPNWDPNQAPLSPNAVGALMGLPSGIAPEGVDPKLRAEYEAALERNRQEIQKHTEQYRLHDWLKRYPKRAEGNIVLAYSEPPFNLEELKEYVDRYIGDEETKARIVSAVKRNIEKETAKMEKCAQHENR
jgi:hypothetical protein